MMPPDDTAPPSQEPSPPPADAAYPPMRLTFEDYVRMHGYALAYSMWYMTPAERWAVARALEAEVHALMAAHDPDDAAPDD